MKQQPVYMNEKGEVYLKDKSGRPIKLEVDNLGRPFQLNSKGERVYVG